MRTAIPSLVILGASLTLAALAPRSALAEDTSIHVSGTVLMECGTASLGLAGYREVEACLQFSPGGAGSTAADITDSGATIRGYTVVYPDANLTLVLDGETRVLAYADRYASGPNYTELGNYQYATSSGDYATLWYIGPNGYVQQGIYTSSGSTPGGWLDDEFQLVPGYTPKVSIYGGIDRGNTSWISYRCTFMAPNRGQGGDETWSDVRIGTGPCGQDAVDTDGDGVEDGTDNCAGFANADQADSDGEGIGDACDLCPTDAANADVDEDLVCDVTDSCLGDNATGDEDADGWCNDEDLCFGNDTLGDHDGDGWCEDEDNCPVHENDGQADDDGDGQGDACDDDDDGDGAADDVDNCAGLANVGQDDGDGDGQGDACDDDDDDDAVADGSDNCPVVSNASQADFDDDGLGDACDGDDDADAVADDVDQCASTPLSALVNSTGCSGQQYVLLTAGTASNYRNHGEYVSAVARAVAVARSQGLLTGSQGAVITSAAAKSGR